MVLVETQKAFAVYGYNKYFTDKDKGAVLRLGNNGITEISCIWYV